MQLYYYCVFVFISNSVRGKPVSCWNYLCTWAFYHGFSKGSMSVIFVVNHAASHSTLKFSGWKQPVLITSHESKGHLCSSAHLSQDQTISAGPILLSALSAGLAGSWQVRGYP